MKKRVNDSQLNLVTGGAGFIGSHVVDELIKLGHGVIVLDDLSGGFEDNINKDAEFIKGSINDKNLLDVIFEKYNINCIYHLAAYAAEGLSHFIRNFNYNNNLIGSINLINKAINTNVKRFVFSSSIAVYGTNQIPMLETLVPKPEDPYGISKYAVELDLMAAHEIFGLDYTIFRPHNVYGSRQNHGDPYRNVLGIFINNILLGNDLTIFGDGNQTRAFSHVSDVAPYIARCTLVDGTKNEIFNIGADKPYSVLFLAETIKNIMSVENNIVHLPARNEVIHAYSSHEKARRIFSIENTTSLNDGIKEMLEWSIKKGPMTTKKFGYVEVPKNIPPSWKKLI